MVRWGRAAKPGAWPNHIPIIGTVSSCAMASVNGARAADTTYALSTYPFSGANCALRLGGRNYRSRGNFATGILVTAVRRLILAGYVWPESFGSAANGSQVGARPL